MSSLAAQHRQSAGEDVGTLKTANRQRTVLDSVWLGLLLLTIYLSSANFGSRPLQTDVMAAYAPASELVHHGTLFIDRLHGAGPWMVHVGNHFAELRFPGATLWAVPFYVFDGSHQRSPSAAPAAVEAATAAVVAMVLLYLMLRRITARRTAIAATLVAALATSTWSVSADQLWEHGPAQMTLLAALLALANRRLLIAGFCLGLGVMVRPHLGIAAVAIACTMAIAARSLGPLIKIGAGCLPGVVGYLIYNRLLFDTWSWKGGYGTGCHAEGCVNTSFHASTFFGNLSAAVISPGRGILLYSPFLILLVPGIRQGWRVSSPWVRGAAIGGTLYLVANFIFMDYVGTFYYGYRIPLEMLTLVSPLLVQSYHTWVSRSSGRKRALAVLIALSVIIQALGAWPFTPPLGKADAWTTSDLVHAAHGAGPIMVGTVTLAVAGFVFLLIRRWSSIPADRFAMAPVGDPQCLQ